MRRFASIISLVLWPFCCLAADDDVCAVANNRPKFDHQNVALTGTVSSLKETTTPLLSWKTEIACWMSSHGDILPSQVERKFRLKASSKSNTIKANTHSITKSKPHRSTRSDPNSSRLVGIHLHQNSVGIGSWRPDAPTVIRPVRTALRSLAIGSVLRCSIN